MKLLGALLLTLVGLWSTPTPAQTVTNPAPVALACAYSTVVPTPTAGQFYYVQCDSTGKLITTGTSIVPDTTLFPCATAGALAYSTGPAPSGVIACANGVTTGGANLAIAAAATATGFSAANQSLFIVGTYTGSGAGPFAEFGITDTATNTTAGTALVGARVDHSFGGAGTGAGNRTAIQAILTQNGATPGTNDALKFYTGIFGQVYINSGDGGIMGTPRGDYYGMAAIAQAQTGATFLNQIVGMEADVAVQTGASVAYKSVMTLISVNSDAVKGSTFDAMLAFTRDVTTTVGFNYGISFGRGDSFWPIDATVGTLIGTTAPSSGSRAAKYGVDFRGVTFTDYPFASNNFYVDQTGIVNSGGYIANGSSAGLTLFSRSGAGTTFVLYSSVGTYLNVFSGTHSDIVSISDAGRVGAASFADFTTGVKFVDLIGGAGNYVTVYDGSGNGALFVGGASNQKTMYRNNNHLFQWYNSGTATVEDLANINSSGLQSYRALTVGTPSSIVGAITLYNATNNNTTTIKAGVASASRTYTWPLTFGGAGSALIDAAGDGTLSWVAGLSTTKTVRASGGGSDCTLIYTNGLLTGGSC